MGLNLTGSVLFYLLCTQQRWIEAMKCYFWQRFKPFLCFMILAELAALAGKIYQSFDKFDFAPWELLKVLGVLGLTSAIAFMYLMIPYLLYLLFLPKGKQNSHLDKIVTTVMFSTFVYTGLFQVAATQIFWEEFQAAFNFIAVDYLVYTNEVVMNIWESYPVVWILSALLVLTVVIVRVAYRHLFTEVPAPGFGGKLWRTAVYALVLVGAYFAVDLSKLEICANAQNNEAAKEGTYSLFSAFLKNELPYDKFYKTQPMAENLEILREKLGGDHVTFLAPDKGIARRITANKPEIRANVIIVLMESMSAEYMNENLPEGYMKITPSLEKLSKEGLYFSRAYANGTRSVRGIEALTLGVPPLPGMSIVRRQNNENLHSIGSIFKEKGYDNKWIYGGFGYFDNMNYFFGNNGFQVVDRKTWDEGDISFVNAWGASDEDTFRKVIKEADKSYAAGKPFLSMILTISNHRPYTYPAGKIPLESGEWGRIGGVMYADYAIGQFVEEAKKHPWFDNTVFVFVADHTAGASGKEEINLDGHHIPMIFYAPKLIKARRIDTPVSQIDALPTLLGLLNFDYESRFYGQDALKPGYESRFFVSNYQKIGYVKNGTDVILKPVREMSVEGKVVSDEALAAQLREAIAFYQQADEWEANLKE